MAFEEVKEAIENKDFSEPKTEATPTEGSAEASASNGSLAPDSDKAASAVFDLNKAEKFLFDGKEMTPKELNAMILRQKEFTKKTQALAEERRRDQQEKQEWKQQQEQEKLYTDNYEIDIRNVLMDPSKESRFKEIYPVKFHNLLDQALAKQFGDPNSPKRNDTVLEQRLKSVEGKFEQREREIAKAAFDESVATNSEILDSNLQRLSQKYPLADEDSVLARAEHMASSLKKDASFNEGFSKIMEKLYKENHTLHENRYKSIYKEKVEKQKQANARGKDVGAGGATPGAAPAKMKLKDVKNHILGTMGINQ